MNKVEILIIHLIEKEDPVAEIYLNGDCFALIEEKNGKPIIHFYPHPSKKEWEIPFEELVQIIEKACAKILSKQEKWKSYFPPTPSTTAEANRIGQSFLEEILNHSDKVHQNRFGGMDIYEPSGRGARFNAAEEFLGFLQSRFDSKIDGFEIVISSDTIFNQLCAEIYFMGEFVAIISQEEGLDKANIEINPNKDSKCLFSFTQFQQVLKESHLFLLAMGKNPTRFEKHSKE